jgi:hypothetical protein
MTKKGYTGTVKHLTYDMNQADGPCLQPIRLGRDEAPRSEELASPHNEQHHCKVTTFSVRDQRLARDALSHHSLTMKPATLVGQWIIGATRGPTMPNHQPKTP